MKIKIEVNQTHIDSGNRAETHSCPIALAIKDKKELKIRPKFLCREKTRRLIKQGIIIKNPCEICGEIKVQIHHDDYNNPYQVRFLCINHHIQHHAKAGA